MLINSFSVIVHHRLIYALSIALETPNLRMFWRTQNSISLMRKFRKSSLASSPAAAESAKPFEFSTNGLEIDSAPQ